MKKTRRTYMSDEEQRVVGGHRGPCLPLALARSTGIPLEEIMPVCRKYGYPLRGNGMRHADGIKVLEEFGVELERVGNLNKWHSPTDDRWRFTDRYPTVAQFRRVHNRGTYLIGVRGHAFVIRNGNVIDSGLGWTSGDRRRVSQAHRIFSIEKPSKLQQMIRDKQRELGREWPARAPKS